jgi:hypothetical protein
MHQFTGIKIMQNLKFRILLLISIFSVTACALRKPISGDTTTARAQIATTIVAQKPPKYIPKGNIYETKYYYCSFECRLEEDPNRTPRSVITWGKPTEVGIIYAKRNYPEIIKMVPEEKLKLPNNIYQGNVTNASLVIKSKGVLSGTKSPLPTEKFTPTNALSTPILMRNRVFIFGRIRIVSIKPLNPIREEFEFNRKVEFVNNFTSSGMLTMEAAIPAYYQDYQNKPDIKPQQVDKITWQEGQPPQIIPVRQW